jgi:hypothetical protein
MSRRRDNRKTFPTKEERDKRLELTIARIRALTGAQAKDLLEDLITRNEFTGICLHACEFVDKVAMETIELQAEVSDEVVMPIVEIQAEIARQVEHLNPKLKFVDSVNPGATRFATCHIGSLSETMIVQNIALAIARTFKTTGTLAWDRLEEDKRQATAIVRFVSAQ